MGWFNYFGMIAVAIILVPNIISAVFDKASFENKCKNNFLIVSEQVGRYGCMTFNIPYTYFNFWFEDALTVYLIVNGALLALHLLGWALFFKGRKTIKMLWLPIIPTMIFLFSGVMLLSVTLIVLSIVFGVGHITISYKNRK